MIAKRLNEHVRDLYSDVRICYRTPTDLGLLERFHRTFNDEETCWRLYDNSRHYWECIADFRERYNRSQGIQEQSHQAVD